MDENGMKFKIIILGDAGVGKTCFLGRYAKGHYEEKAATIGENLTTKIIQIDNKQIKLSLWDTAGQERYRSLPENIYRGTAGVILMYDVENLKSYEKIRTWLEIVDIHCDNPVKIIVGSKTDSGNRKVTQEEGRKLAREYTTLFMEASAKTGDGVESVFEELVRKIIQTPHLVRVPDSERIHLEDNQTTEQSTCTTKCCR